MSSVNGRSRRARRWTAFASVTALVTGGVVALFEAPASGSQTPRAPTIRVGTQTLTRCRLQPLAYCGRLLVPLDWRARRGPRITIAYRWYPATQPVSPDRTVVPIEGGPGLPTTASVDGYRAMYRPLLRHWNLLAVDNRGTGASTPLDCRRLQRFHGSTAGPAFQRVVGRCGATLDHRWRYPDGRWVHASDLFASASTARDLAAVIRALRLDRIDLYGDSYGSWLAQVFAARFPGLIRSVVLDSTYETVNLDPWYRGTIRAMPAAFDVVCRRAPACASAARGSSWSRLRALARSLRRHPISGTVPSHTGTLRHVTMHVTGLVDLLNDAAEDPGIYQAIDAAARAWLRDRDPAPLLRLYDQRLAYDENYFGVPASEDSAGLYFAVACLDYPQLFDMHATPSARTAELAAAEAALPASTFSPFTVREWMAQNENTEAYTACIQWPAPKVAEGPIVRSLPLLPASIPVLVLAGELDTITPPAGAGVVLSQIGGRSRLITFANATHVVGAGNTYCASVLVQEFVAEPAGIGGLDASCAYAVPAIHAVGAYVSRLAAVVPLRPLPGSTTNPAALRLAAAALSTAADAISRYDSIVGSADHGLRGGTVRASDDGRLLTLKADQLIPGVAISGEVRLSNAANPLDGQIAVATLTATARNLPAGSFTARWATGGGASATVSGPVGALQVQGTAPAP